jgi:hypothetical protein
MPFSKTILHSSFTAFETASCGSCNAATSLTAVKNGNQIQLNWIGDPSVNTFSYGGYYNYNTAPYTGTFSGTIGGNQKTITVPYDTYSITYRVTSDCPDGSTTESLPSYTHF